LEQTLVILKPDCVGRRLVGRVIGRLEDKGLQIAGLKMMRMDRPLAETMYAEHEGKEFYEPLLRFMTGGPVVMMVVRGKDAVGVVRALLGPTFGPDAPPGTLRGDFGMSKRFNLVHGSDSPESARRELSLFFEPDELLDEDPADLDRIYDTSGPELV
jgi:nucleoside-diphosphate kinase